MYGPVREPAPTALGGGWLPGRTAPPAIGGSGRLGMATGIYTCTLGNCRVRQHARQCRATSRD
eukprot:11518714-Alexandrium_andersonii.AAC.1